MKFRCYLAILGPLLCCGSLLAQAPPPRAPVRPVTDDYFGTKIVDPYRWMEDAETKNPELTAWMKAQNAYTCAVALLSQHIGNSNLLASDGLSTQKRHFASHLPNHNLWLADCSYRAVPESEPDTRDKYHK